MFPEPAWLLEQWPAPSTIGRVAPPALLWGLGALWLAGWLKTRRGLRSGYSRKIFHFLIFAAATVTHLAEGLPGVLVFGTMTGLVIGYALLRGDGHLLYEAMARASDRPHRTWYIVVPFIATLMGGLTANLLFPSGAAVGYLVTGVGDAIGEPVGTRWGRHRYRVPSRRSVPVTRSVEGSAAVFLVSFGAVLLLGWHGAVQPFSGLLITAAGIALAVALAEALAPHGVDNFVLQVLASGLAHRFLFSP